MLSVAAALSVLAIVARPILAVDVPLTATQGAAGLIVTFLTMFVFKVLLRADSGQERLAAHFEQRWLAADAEVDRLRRENNVSNEALATQKAANLVLQGRIDALERELQRCGVDPSGVGA